MKFIMLLHVGFEVLTAVTMKSTVCWELSGRSYLYSRRMHCLHLDAHRVSQDSSQQSALEMNAVCSSPSQTLVNFYQTTQHQILLFIVL
jgi:hypothetical protein